MPRPTTDSEMTGQEPETAPRFEPSVDEATGRSNGRWRFLGQECATVPLTGPMANQLASYVQIESDLKDAKAWMTLAFKLLDADGRGAPTDDKDRFFTAPAGDLGDQIKALMFSAITTYGKCFVTATGRRIKLEERDHVASELRAKHGQIMSLRHQLTAHAGQSPGPVPAFARSVLILPPDPSIGPPLVRVELHSEHFIDDRSDTVNFLRLIDQVQNTVAQKASQLSAKLSSDALGHPLDYWRVQAK